MLHDSPVLVDESNISREHLTVRGTIFPLTPTDGQPFQLTIDIQDFPKGLYLYSVSMVTWIVQDTYALNPYDMGFSVLDIPEADAIISSHVLARSVILPEDFMGSIGIASVVSTAQIVFQLEKVSNEVVSSLATLTFEAGVAKGIFVPTAIGKDYLVVTGEIIRIKAPATEDASISQISITLAGRLAVAGF